jgi:hypothetical protein
MPMKAMDAMKHCLGRAPKDQAKPTDGAKHSAFAKRERNSASLRERSATSMKNAQKVTKDTLSKNGGAEVNVKDSCRLT